MISILLICFFGIFQARAFSPFMSVTNCPNIAPQSGFNITEIAGTWRLGYLYMDEVNDFEEDNTCAIAEIVLLNQTKMELLMFMDSRQDKFTIDRYTKEFDVTVLTPGEWLIHVSFGHLEFVHVTVIDFFKDHLILTFCTNHFSPESLLKTSALDYDSFRGEEAEKESVNEIFNEDPVENVLKDADESRTNHAKKPSRFFRKRFAEQVEERTEVKESSLPKVDKRDATTARKNHLWTAILVKKYRNSDLEFVENAALLMKYGFKISKGQFISFGSCTLTK